MKLRAIPTMLSMIRPALRGVAPQDLETIQAIARQAYPAVAQIRGATLAEWMQRTDAAALLLVDVRSPAEFAVSHLQGALNLRTAAAIGGAVRERRPARTVLYCAVGFRSTRMAQVLAKRGLPGIMNLEGSIFRWANEGREVYQGTVAVRHVHPVGQRWAGLLAAGLPAPVR